jgi:hypothetical protein
MFGGQAAEPAFVELWNGSTWTEQADLATGRSSPVRAGSSVSALAGGGGNVPGVTAVTEEWSIPDAIKTFTAS